MMPVGPGALTRFNAGSRPDKSGLLPEFWNLTSASSEHLQDSPQIPP